MAQNLSIWQNLRTSARTAQDSIYFRCETTPDAINFSKHLYYFSNNQWICDSLQYLSGATFQSKFQVNQDSTNIRISIEGNNTFSGMSAYIQSDNFPINLSALGECGADSINEIDSQYNNCLDITNQYSGFNNEKIYGGISTVGDITNSGGWTGPFYIYGFAIANPVTALQDTIGYAMIYAEIPVLLNPGLYKIRYNSINPLDDITRIGDIDYDISDNQIVMQASLNDLLTDPDFGEWLPEAKYLLCSTFTISMSASRDVGIVDYGEAALLNLKKFVANTGTNNLPVITNVNSIANIITCTYNDSDNNFPLVHEIITDNGNVFEMIPDSYDFTNNVQFTANLGSINWDSATIRFSDNNVDFVESQIGNTGNENNSIPESNENLVVYPNPFFLETCRAQLNLKFSTKEAETTTIDLYNIKGKKVLRIFEGITKSGENIISKNIGKNKISSGIYFIRINSASNNETQKIMLLK